MNRKYIKVNKGLIFITLAVFLTSNIAYSYEKPCIRVPVGTVYDRIQDLEQWSGPQLKGNYPGKPIKIGMIHYSFNLPGGVDKIMQQHIDFFLKHGVSVDVLAGMSNIEEERGLKIEKLQELWLKPPHDKYERNKRIILDKLRAWVKDKDIVILHNMLTLPNVNRPFYDAFRELMNTDREVKAKVIAWTHDVEPGAQIEQIPNVIYTAISEKSKAELHSALPELKEIPLTQNVIDFDGFLELSYNVKKFAARHDLYSQDFLFIYPARLSENKNIERAIRILRDIKDSELKSGKKKGDKITAKLIIVGSTRAHLDYEARYYAKLIDLIGELKLEGDVIFTGDEYVQGRQWHVSDNELSSLYKLSDCLLFTSNSEGFGLPVVEAAGMGIPVVTLDIAPMNILLTNTLKLPREYRKEDSRAILRFLTRGNIAKRAQREALTRYNIEFSWDSILPILGLSLMSHVVGGQTSKYSNKNIEDQLYHASAVENFSLFEIFFDGFYPSQIYAPTRKYIKEFSTRHRIKLQVFAPLVNISSEEGKRHAMDSIDFAKDIGAKTLVIKINRGDISEGFYRALADLCEAAQDNGILIALENAPGLMPSDINQVMDRLPQYNETLGCSFSVGNANISSDPISYLRGLKAPIFCVKLSDNNGDTAEHIRIGRGTIDFNKIIPAISKRAGDPVPFILEYWHDQRKNDKNEISRLSRFVTKAGSPDTLFLRKIEGGIDNIILKNTICSAHIQIPEESGNRVTVAIPYGEACFRLETNGQEKFEINEDSVKPFELENRQRGVTFDLTIRANKVEIPLSSILLDHILRVRMQDWRGGNEPIHYEEEFSSILEGKIDAILNNPANSFVVEIENRRKASFKGIKQGLGSRGKIKVDLADNKIILTRQEWDGRHSYVLEISPQQGCTIGFSKKTNKITLKGDKNITLTLRASADFMPYTPVSRNYLLNKEGRRLAESSPEFEQSFRNFEILAYREKFLAGSPNFLAYYGRDTLIAMRNLWTVLSKEAKDIGFSSVARQVSKDGMVNVTDEWMYGMASLAKIGEFNSKFNSENYAEALEILVDIHKGKIEPRYFFDVLDQTFLFPAALNSWFKELEDKDLKDWIDAKHRNIESPETRIETLERNWEYVIKSAEQYADAFDALRERHREYNNLSPAQFIKKMKDSHGDELRSSLSVKLIHAISKMGNWMDNTPILGGNRFPEDINASLVPMALQGIVEMSSRIAQLYPDSAIGTRMNKIKNKATRIIEPWSYDAISGHFAVYLSEDEIRARLKDYLNALRDGSVFQGRAENQEELEMLLNRKIGRDSQGKEITVSDFVEKNARCEDLKNGFTFTAIVLDEKGYPVPVMHANDVFFLMFGNPDIEQFKRICSQFIRPYPVGLGLWEDKIGFVVANSIFAPHYWNWSSEWYNDLWNLFSPDRYHGASVWGWTVAGFLQGLYNMLEAKNIDMATLNYAEETLVRYSDMLSNIGDLDESELWQFIPSQRRRGLAEIRPASMSTPVQLWSVAPYSLLLEKIRAAINVRKVLLVSRETREGL